MRPEARGHADCARRYLAGYVVADPHLSRLADEAFRLVAYVATGLIDAGEPVRGHILDAVGALQAAGLNSRAV